MKKKKIVISMVIICILVPTFIYLYLFRMHGATTAVEVLSPQDLSVPTLAYDDTSITLVWHKPDNYSNIKNYNIYMNGKLIGNANDNKSKAKQLIDTFYKDSSNSSAVNISMHNYLVTDLKPDTSYTFTVRAVDSNGHEAPDSNKVVQSTTKTPEVFDVTKYGAVGDGQTLDTVAIQKAIDVCTSGGKVLIPAGKTFKSGSLWLKGDMTFEVEGKVLGSDNPEDYNNKDNPKKSNALINAANKNNSQNLKIVGSGVIDGNGWK